MLPLTKNKNKKKIIDKLIRFTWESLESHLNNPFKKYNHATNRPSDWIFPESYHENWDIKCIKDYAEMIKLLSELY